MSGRHPAPRTIASKVKAFLKIDAVRLLVVDQPALSSQQSVDAVDAISHTNLGNFIDPRSLSSVIARVRFVVII
jgi:hypothetical protein